VAAPGRVARFLERLEDTPGGAALWAVALLCVIVVRELIELALEYPTARLLEAWFQGAKSGPAPTLSAGAGDAAMLLLHWPGFYLAVFLGLTLALSLCARVELARTARAVVWFFPIIWLPPILDAIVTRGRGYVLDYNTTLDFTTLVRTFYNPGAVIAGVSPGIRVEILLATGGAMIYVAARRKRVLAVLLGGLLTTLIPLALGSWPGWIRSILRAPDGNPHGRIGAAYLIALIPLGALWCWRAAPGPLRAALGNLRWLRALHYVLMAALGIVIALCELPPERPAFPDALLPSAAVLLAIFFAFQFNVQANDLADRDTDAVSNPDRPLARRALGERDVLWLAALFGVWSVALAASVHTMALLLVLAYDAVGLLYSAPPFRLRRFFPLATLLLAGCSVLAMLAGFSVLAGPDALLFFPRRAVVLLVIAFMTAFHFKDMKDIEGDRAAGIRTLPVLLGRPRARWVVAALMLAAYVAVPPLVGRGGILWLSPLFGLATAVLIVRRDRPHEPTLFALYFGYAILMTVALVRAPHAPAFRASNLGAYLLVRGQSARALAAFDDDPGLSASDRELGRALARLGDGDAPAAVEHARGAAGSGDDVEADLVYAYALAADGQPGAAEAIYRRVIARDASSAIARFNLGTLAFDRAQFADAEAHFRAALGARPDWAEARFDLGNCLLKQHRAADAELEYRRALVGLRANAALHNNLGLALEQQGRAADARAEFARAVSLDPTLAVARANRDRVAAP
jgi:4-hydroxybenzoate polyprenyltransferase/Tfp pilus assembly protein PilF